MPTADEILLAAKSLNRAEQRQLIARLSESISRENVPPPTDEELALLRQPSAKSDVVRKLIAGRHSASSAKIYSAPRRFDLATIFVVTSAFALLLGGMSLIGILPGISLVVAGFIMVVGAGQALLFGGRKPRLASVIVGIGFCTLAIIGISFLTGRALQADLLVLTLPVSFIYGVPSGYIAGVLVGGVFLVADVLRKLFARGEREQIAEEE